MLLRIRKCCGFKLINCEDEEDIIYTRSSLSLHVGRVVRIEEDDSGSGYGKCYDVEELCKIPNDAAFEPVTVIESFSSCEACVTSECDTGCYKLTSCLGG